MTSVLPSSAATVIFDNAGQELGTPLIPIDWSVFDFESPTDFTPPYIWSEDFSSIIGGDSPVFIEIGQADPNFVDLSIDLLTGQPLSELIDAHRQQVLIDSLISELAQSDPLEALNWLNNRPSNRDTTVIPEPSSALLALLGMGFFLRRRR